MMNLNDFFRWVFDDKNPSKRVTYNYFAMNPFPYSPNIDARKEFIRGHDGRYVAILDQMSGLFEKHLIVGSIVFLEVRSDGNSLEKIGRLDCPKLDCHPKCPHEGRPLTIDRFRDLEQHFTDLIFEKLEFVLDFFKPFVHQSR